VRLQPASKSICLVCLGIYNLYVVYIAQLVEAQGYRLEGNGVRFLIGSLTSCFWSLYGPGVDSASNRNEYQGSSLRGKGSQCVGHTALPPLCAACLKILGVSTSWSPRVLLRPVQGWLYIFTCTWRTA
jgi:hypothetical protein